MKLIKNKTGLTLIELIISIAMIGIIFIVLITILTSGYVQILDMGKRTDAKTLAQETIEQITNNSTTISGTLVSESDLLNGAIGSVRYHIDSNKILTVVVRYGPSDKYVEIKTVAP